MSGNTGLCIESYLKRFPLVAILRGVQPDEVEGIGAALVEAGFAILEVPLNSPDPLSSIERLARRFPETLIGAGTVMTPQAVREVAQAGGKLILMPHSDGEVVRAARAAGLLSMPGVATPTEAFAALANGANSLKLFPAEQLGGAAVVKAWRAVVPRAVPMLPVGGITAENMGPYLAAGASGFGLGTSLYRPGMTAAEVAVRAAAFKEALARPTGRRLSTSPPLRRRQ
jgi:2-dehydro-3-deoxyphosphogalactonate aldolase